jgi:hypothetical protein
MLLCKPVGSRGFKQMRSDNDSRFKEKGLFKMRKMKVQPECPPEGSYVMCLREIEEIPGKFGPALCFQFVVVSGEHAGKGVSRTTAMQIRIGESLGDLLTEMTGSIPIVNEQINLDVFVGMLYRVEVKTGHRGGRYAGGVSQVGE